MSIPRLASMKTCTGCLACVDICHQKALTNYVSNDGHVYVKCDESKCILCLRCEKICPIVNGMVYSSNQLQESEPFSLYFKDNKICNNSTSGGAFISIALAFIEDGGYVCGAIFTPMGNVKHIVTNNIEDVYHMQGSKYMQSDTSGIYKNILALLNEKKKVLFTGMGCQAAAIISYFKNNKNKHLLYVIDLICGGVPSYLLVQKFLENEKTYIRIAGFRDKNKYVLSCYDKMGQIVYLDNKRTLPLFGFYSDLTKRYSCGDCRFCGIERESDLTIGDYWGDKDTEKHKSVVIIHSDRGKNLIEKTSNTEVHKIDWSFVRQNYRYVIGKNYNNSRLQRRMLPWIFNHLSYKCLCGLYGCNLKNPFWFTIAIYNHFVTKLHKFYINYKMNKIMNKIQGK